jgi:hypothetical protein
MKPIVWIAAVLVLVNAVGTRPSAQTTTPQYAWMAKAGMSGWDAVSDIAVDQLGNTYMTGTVMAYPNVPPKAFLVKVNANGTTAWTRIFGGNADGNQGIAVVVDAAGHSYVLGHGSYDLPTTSGDSVPPSSTPTFIAEFSPTGTLVDTHAIVVPGVQYNGRDLAINARNELVVVSNARIHATGQDWIQVELVASRVRTTLATLQGSGHDHVAAVAVPASGQIYIAGHTTSSNFPLTGDALDTTPASSDAFVTVLDGSSIVYSTLAGGSFNEEGNDIAVDEAGNLYLLAESYAADFPGTAGSATAGNTGTARVLKIDAARNIAYSARLNGPMHPHRVAVDAAGSVYVTGITLSSTYPLTTDAYSTFFTPSGGTGSASPVLARLDPQGTIVEWSSLLTHVADGYDQDEMPPAIALDASGGVYLGLSAYNQRYYNGNPLMEPSFNNYEDVSDATFKRNSYALKFTTTITPPPPPSNTPTGSAILVAGASATVTFGTVTAPGETTILPIDPGVLLLGMPGEFTLSEGVQAVEITTTATIVPPIQVCFNASALTEDEFGRAEILHGVGGSWVVEPTVRDSVSRTLCATVGSLSPFAVGIRAKPPTYRVAALYDQARTHKSGSTVPVKVQLLDAAGVNVSSEATTLTVQQLVRVSDEAASQAADSGQANPDFGFRFADGAYMYNLSTKGLTVGTYELRFTAGSEATVYSVRFAVR